MRLFAVHDSEGTIVEMVMSPADGPAPVLETGPGVAYTEVKPPEGLSEDTDLRELMKYHRVDVARRQGSPAPLASRTPMDSSQA